MSSECARCALPGIPKAHVDALTWQFGCQDRLVGLLTSAAAVKKLGSEDADCSTKDPGGLAPAVNLFKTDPGGLAPAVSLLNPDPGGLAPAVSLLNTDPGGLAPPVNQIVC